MVLAEVMHEGAAFARLMQLINNSFQTDEEKQALACVCQDIFATLIDAGVIVKMPRTRESNGAAAQTTEAAEAENDSALIDSWMNADYKLAVDIPDDFALDQMLAPFVIAACELIDRTSLTYALDIVSLVEASLENPPQIMKALVKEAKNKALAEMKMEGIDYEERMERLEGISYEKPLQELIEAAYERYCKGVPWAREFQLYPKSIVRAMLELSLIHISEPTRPY